MSDNEYTPEAWRMAGYYPESYAKFMAALGIGIDYDDGDFDRYEAEFRADLAEHDREVAAKALTDAAAQLRMPIDGQRPMTGDIQDWLRTRAAALVSAPSTPEQPEGGDS